MSKIEIIPMNAAGEVIKRAVRQFDSKSPLKDQLGKTLARAGKGCISIMVKNGTDETKFEIKNGEPEQDLLHVPEWLKKAPPTAEEVARNHERTLQVVDRHRRADGYVMPKTLPSKAVEVETKTVGGERIKLARRKDAAEGSASVQIAGSAEYKGHRAGSRKGYVHRVFDESGEEAASKVGEQLGLKKGTISSWFIAFRKVAKPVRKAVTSKQPAAKEAPKVESKTKPRAKLVRKAK